MLQAGKTCGPRRGSGNSPAPQSHGFRRPREGLALTGPTLAGLPPRAPEGLGAGQETGIAGRRERRVGTGRAAAARLALSRADPRGGAARARLPLSRLDPRLALGGVRADRHAVGLHDHLLLRRRRAEVGAGGRGGQLRAVDLHRAHRVQPLLRARLPLAGPAPRARALHQEVDLPFRDARLDRHDPRASLRRDLVRRADPVRGRADARSALDGAVPAVHRDPAAPVPARRLLVPDGARLVHARHRPPDDLDRAGADVSPPRSSTRSTTCPRACAGSSTST